MAAVQRAAARRRRPPWSIANHAIGLFQLAALHLSQRPPNLEEAPLAIDAMGALVEGLAGRLGEDEAPLKDGPGPAAPGLRPAPGRRRRRPSARLTVPPVVRG